jgi:type II secretory pathway predicted ATPase ExeA/outer membrane protein OmpA-like peptidoglycan-associated protein
VQGQLVGHFGLRENPFGVTPDPRFLFLSQTHREALASLVNGIDCDFGFQILVAQPGMGKTTLLFNFLERFRGTAHTAFLFQPQSNPVELLQSVLIELGTHSEETSLRKLSEQLNQVLTRSAEEHKRVIVVLDEAQNLDFSVLEALRQLSNFETASSKLMQIILAGQPQLAKRLALPEQEQLMQRISAFGRLSPLALTETQAYIEHRLATAGYQGAHLFTQGAIRSIWERSRGVPRNINTLCFGAMMLAFAEHARSIDNRIIDEAGRDLDLNSVLADLYQATSSRPISQPKILPIRETIPLESDSSEGVKQAPTSQGGILIDAGALASAGQSSKPVGAEKLLAAPASPSTSIASPVEQKVEEKKIALVEKAAPLAGVRLAAPSLPVTVPPQTTKAIFPAQAPAAAGKPAPPRTSAAALSVPSAAVPKNNAANQAKNTPPKKREESVRPQPQVAIAKAALNKQQVAEKRSESRIWWAKALALTALTGVLAFVLGEQYLTQRPEQVEANGSSASSQAQGSSGSSNDGGSLGTDTPGGQTKNAPADFHRTRNADFSEANDVTVRKFPADSDFASDTSGKTQRVTTILFEQDSTVIGSQYGSSLQRVAEALAENPGASAILEGHTDDIGPEGYNQELSSRRAIEVRNALVDQLHVPTSRLTAVGAGAAAPAQPNSSSTGRAYNRRVEIRLVHLGE